MIYIIILVAGFSALTFGFAVKHYCDYKEGEVKYY